MNTNLIASEVFSRGKRHYFLDFKQSVLMDNYIRITRSDQTVEGDYIRSSVVIFEEDFHALLQACSSLFQTAVYSKEGEVSVQDLWARSQAKADKKDVR